jgi:glucosamine-6-phosphate deaminase
MKAITARLIYTDSLETRIFADAAEMGACAAQAATAVIQSAIRENGSARIVVATGASQFSFYEHFIQAPIDWSVVEVLHLDEYVGIQPDHPASFRGYLRERFVARVSPQAFHELNGTASDPAAECRRYGDLLAARQPDLCVCGIGENGHLAFNDPPVADFADPLTAKVVDLDDACRRQQLGEGWFPTLDDVPKQALSLTIPAVLSARRVIVVVPDRRKAAAVRLTLTGPIETACPASVLRRHAHVQLFLDEAAAGELG